MVEAGGEPDLREEALATEHRGELRTQNLERDLPAVLHVPGEVDGGHAPAPELALERVAITEDVGQCGGHHVGHGQPCYGDGYECVPADGE